MFARTRGVFNALATKRRNGEWTAGIGGWAGDTHSGNKGSMLPFLRDSSRWATRSRKSSTRCRARAPIPAGRRCSCALPAATCGRAARPTARKRCAASATPSSSAPTAPAAGSSKRRQRSQLRSRRVACASAAWPAPGSAAAARERLVVCTGGEPLLQLDAALVAALRARGFMVAVETNGTLAPPAGELWLTVSPKAGAPLKLDARRRTEAGVSAGRRRAGALRAAGIQAFLSAAHGRPGARRATRAWRSSTVSRIRSGACRCRRTN